MIVRGNFVTRALARWIARKVDAVVDRRDPDFIIGGMDDPYLLRWYLLPRNTWGNIYVHEYRRPDDDRALHDHPWHSVSLGLRGTIIDVTDSGRKDFRAGDLAFRGVKKPHRIDLYPGFAFGYDNGQRTLFMMGPRRREWGFHCPKGWVHWKDFTKAKETGDSSRVGRGCD